MKIVTRFRYWLYYCFVLVFLIVTGCEENVDKSDENEIQPPVDTTKQDTFPALGHDGPYSPDSIYYGRESYVEYHAGNLPIYFQLLMEDGRFQMKSQIVLMAQP